MLWGEGPADPLQARHLAGTGNRTAAALEDLDQVTIGAINGLAIGGAVVFLASMDLRLAAESAWFSIPEIDLDIPLTWNGLPRLMRELGPARTKELVMTGDRFSAEEALEWGFLNRITPDRELLPSARALAAKLLSKEAMSLALTKSTTRALANMMVPGDVTHSDREYLLSVRNAARPEEAIPEIRRRKSMTVKEAAPAAAPSKTPAPYKSPWMNDELKMFRKTAARFIREEFLPHEARWREQHRPDAEAWTKAGQTGLLLTDVPEEYGGGGGTFAHEAVMFEEMAYAGVHLGSGVHSIVAHYVLSYGTEEQKRRWLPQMAQGELVGAIAMSEPVAGSDLQGIKTTARREGDTYVINGSKTFITNGWHASLICLAVKTDTTQNAKKGISLVMVEAKNLPGYRVGRILEKVGTHGQDTCELFFDDVRVPADNLLAWRKAAAFIK